MNSSENSTPNSSSEYPYHYKSYLSSPSDISSKDGWYHGELGDEDAARILKGSAIGSFLVRRAASSKYYLSIMDDDQRIKHIPIRQINGYYFIDGQRFDSLNEIIASNRKAISPAAKKDTHTQDFLESKYLCVKSYEKCDVDEMSAEIGDILSVYETDDPEWMIGRNESSGIVGLIPNYCIQPLIMEVEDLGKLPYFYDSISTEVVHLNLIGSFLLRRSSKGADTYALLVKTQYDLIEKFLIVGSPTRGFYLAGRPFKTIGHLLNRYCDRAISGGVRLNHAVCVEKMRKLIGKCGSMSSSHCEESRPTQKTRKMFRGTSIDTALASTSVHSSSSMPSPTTTASTGIPDGMNDRFADDDYAENLEMTSTIVASTNALRKSREEKHWKDCWLTLSDQSCGSSQLAIYDSQGAAKRRQLIDLSSCTLFWLDESVFSTDGCLFLTPSFPQQPAVFLCFRPVSTFLRWLRLIRARSIFQDAPPPMSQSTVSYAEPNSQMSLLCVEIDKYRSDCLKNDATYSANVLLNGVKVCSSSSFAPTGNKGGGELPVVVIDSKFVVPCIPTCSSTVQLSIVAHPSPGKRGRPCGVSVSVSLPDASSSESVQQDVGFTFKTRRNRFPVLSFERYKPLIDVMRKSPSELFNWPAQVLPQQHKIFMYTCISYLYTQDPVEMSNVFRIIIGDVLASSTPENVFRKDSMATGIVTQCLRHLFKTPFEEFLMENTAFLQAMKSNIEQAVEILVNFVDQRLMTMPLATRLLAVAAQCAKERFEHESHLIKRTLSALLILRVLNPMIFATVSGGNGSAIAKLVQTMANAAASQTDTLTSEGAHVIRRMFDRMIVMSSSEHEKEEVEGLDTNRGEAMNAEWLSCIAHLIGYSLALKSSQQQNNDEIHLNIPLPVLELVRLHQ